MNRLFCELLIYMSVKHI